MLADERLTAVCRCQSPKGSSLNCADSQPSDGKERAALSHLGQELTFGDWARLALRFAALLRDHGLEQGERVIFVENSLEYAVL